MSYKAVSDLFKAAAVHWVDDYAQSVGAALAFYTARLEDAAEAVESAFRVYREAGLHQYDVCFTERLHVIRRLIAQGFCSETLIAEMRWRTYGADKCSYYCGAVRQRGEWDR